MIYFAQKEREDYEVVIEDGKFLYKKSGQILDTSCGPRDAKWIFVLSTSKSLYVGQVNIHMPSYWKKKSPLSLRFFSSPCNITLQCHVQKRKGTFQHSSFLAGGATSAAGRLVVENGTLKVLLLAIYNLSLYSVQVDLLFFFKKSHASVQFIRWHIDPICYVCVTGHLAAQRSLPPDGGELPGVPELPQGQHGRSNQR